MRRLVIRAAAIGAGAIAFVAGCASPGLPPGGPDDRAAPALVGLSPDSGAVNVPRNRTAVFQFDEVVAERPQGGATLADLVLVSPETGAPRVSWRRSAIAVRARGDWRPNTVYTVTLLPGVADLRGNVVRERSEIIFSTGGTIPDTRIDGVVFDWVPGRPAAAARVEAIAPDSTTFVTVADSSGRFTLQHLPPSRYTVRAFVDANRNRVLDGREIWDSASVTLADTARAELYAFAHDTIGPRVTTVEVRDSITLRVSFDRAIDPGQSIDTSLFALTAQDSTRVPIVAARSARDYE
ncbi:MAG: Ig-like domain-containing protein, partial [Gemmatimonadota bacterium]|nr:Ig-like domain-containing protein [Gemmatimonadota bacterium]